MEVRIRPAAREDLEDIKENEDKERVAKKIDDIDNKISQGIPPELAVEKRLRGKWHPILQQRAGDYRIWFIEGEHTDNGKEDILYVVRIMDKNTQKGLDSNATAGNCL